MRVSVQSIEGVEKKHITPIFGVLPTESGEFFKEWFNLSTRNTYCAKDGAIRRGEVSQKCKDFGPFHSVPEGFRVCIGDCRVVVTTVIDRMKRRRKVGRSATVHAVSACV